MRKSDESLLIYIHVATNVNTAHFHVLRYFISKSVCGTQM